MSLDQYSFDVVLVAAYFVYWMLFCSWIQTNKLSSNMVHIFVFLCGQITIALSISFRVTSTIKYCNDCEAAIKIWVNVPHESTNIWQPSRKPRKKTRHRSICVHIWLDILYICKPVDMFASYKSYHEWTRYLTLRDKCLTFGNTFHIQPSIYIIASMTMYWPSTFPILWNGGYLCVANSLSQSYF